jgi:hypothetical protein
VRAQGRADGRLSPAGIWNAGAGFVWETPILFCLPLLRNGDKMDLGQSPLQRKKPRARESTKGDGAAVCQSESEGREEADRAGCGR